MSKGGHECPRVLTSKGAKANPEKLYKKSEQLNLKHNNNLRLKYNMNFRTDDKANNMGHRRKPQQSTMHCKGVLELLRTLGDTVHRTSRVNINLKLKLHVLQVCNSPAQVIALINY